MHDGDALLRAILAHPDEDTPRLAYADWLDERAEDVACDRCRGLQIVPWDGVGPARTAMHCTACAGAGLVSDGRRERAEFIRVQCELAKWPGVNRNRPMVRRDQPREVQEYNERAMDAGVAKLYRRERELLQGGREWFTAFWSKHLDEWICGLPGQAPCLSRDEPAVTLGRGNTAVGPSVKYVFRRGFVERIGGCPAADWLAHADAITAAHPVRKVVLTDRPNCGSYDNGETFSGSISLPGAKRIEMPSSEWYALRRKEPDHQKLYLSLQWPEIEFALPP